MDLNDPTSLASSGIVKRRPERTKMLLDLMRPSWMLIDGYLIRHL